MDSWRYAPKYISLGILIKQTVMKKFIITETRQATYTWYYEVEAENENQALEKVMDCEVDPMNSLTDACDYDDSEYKVEEA